MMECVSRGIGKSCKGILHATGHGASRDVFKKRESLELSGRRSYGLLGSVRSMTYSAANAFLDQEGKMKICRFLGIPAQRIMLGKIELAKWRAGLDSIATVGFVPTMGKIHQGHLALVDNAKKETDVCIASIFVNPAQFAPHEDFLKYPREFEQDIIQLYERGVDYFFVPSQDEMYPNSEFGMTSKSVTSTHVVPDGVDNCAEGVSRPGYFRGVCTVVCKLLNCIQPTHMYLGQKDGMQVIVLKRMVRDLNFPTIVRSIETCRDADGLAMSSRNVYLSEEQRRAAPTLYRALVAIKAAYESGNRSYDDLVEVGKKVLEAEALFSIEYISICNFDTGLELSNDISHSNIMVSAAVRMDKLRILDNILIRN